MNYANTMLATTICQLQKVITFDALPIFLYLLSTEYSVVDTWNTYHVTKNLNKHT